MKNSTKISISSISDSPGIYKFFGKDGKVLYVGKAKNLKKRVRSYFKSKDLDTKTKLLVRQIYKIETIPVVSEFESLLLEAKLIKLYQPKYNVIWKDDKHYIYIKISKEEFPRILFSRRPDQEEGVFFGPFPSKRIVREILNIIRTIIPYCTQSPHIKKACFYTHLNLCQPCPAIIKKMTSDKYLVGKKQYRTNIGNIKRLLTSQTQMVHKYLNKKMLESSKSLNYETAAFYREKLKNLDYLVNNYQPIDSYIENPLLVYETFKKEQDELTTLLKNYFPAISTVSRIECYDVSNILGKFATGSLVTFVDGKSDKNYYRRFKIKTISTSNDFAMLSEVLKRRLRHSEWKLPNLFVIDGGKPQLIVLAKVIKNLGVDIPTIGLAKHYEEIVIPIKGDFIKLRLSLRSPALHLIQRLRDEAHRFAHKYHEYLRLKYLLSSIN